MRIVVGSKNPAKQKAVSMAFQEIGLSVEMEGIDVPSGVSDQPMSDEETARGAVNRAKAALASGAGDIGIGLEGGVMDTPHGMFLTNWCAIAIADGEISLGGGVRIRLPESLAEKVRTGTELGVVIDEWAGGQGISKKEGTVGILTHGRITRARMFCDAAICAYSPLLGALD